MKKLLYVVAFVSSATLGAACSSDLKEACEDFVSTRDACEAMSPPDADEVPKYSIDMCANIDPECQAYFECAILAECKEDANDKFRLDLKGLNAQLEKDAKAQKIEFIECREPENKACTDADLRP